MTVAEPIVEYPPAEELTERRSPMKLSEALRIGSMHTTQAYGEWTGTEDGKDTMCAISTAWYAMTGDSDASNSSLTELLDKANVPHPVEGGVDRLSNVIINLNDTHRWSRPQIADWLEKELGL